MRILYSAVVELDVPSGHAIHTRQICEALAAAGHEVVLLAPHARMPPAGNGLRFEGVRFFGFSAVRFRLYRYLAGRRARKLMRELAPDVIVDKGTPCLAELAALAGQHGIPLVVELNGVFDDPTDPFHRQSLAGVRRAAEVAQLRFLGVSPILGTTIQRQCEIDPVPFALFENGAEVERFPAEGPAAPRDRWGIPEDAFLVGFAGSDNPGYDFHAMLSGVALIRSRDVDAWVLVAGPESLRRRVHEIATELGIGDVLVTTEPVPHAEVAPLLRTLDTGLVVLRDSLDHMAPTAMMLKELLLVGVPVICNLPDCWSGWTLASAVWGVPHAGPEPVAEALAKIAGHPAGARERARRGGEMVRSRYTWNDVARAYAIRLEELMAPTRDLADTFSSDLVNAG